MGNLSRRQFAITAGTLSLALRAASPLTAQTIVDRIKSQLTGDWPTNTPDGFKAGDPSTAVKGTAPTATATMDVLKQAAKSNTNLILTYEPTFYSRADRPADEPVSKAKHDFIERNNLVVFRIRDHWQSRNENEMVTGLAAALGWSSH